MDFRARARPGWEEPASCAKLWPVTSFRSSLALGLSVATLFVTALGWAHAPSTAPSASQSVNFATYVKGAAELEGKIIAPCCWTQTIDIHGSPLSTELRQEIRTRLTAGESAQAIEQSLVARYGPKILAVPAGSQLGSAGSLLGIAMAVAGWLAAEPKPKTSANLEPEAAE